MEKLSDEEWRLELGDRVNELNLAEEKFATEDQLSILSDKAMNCERGDAAFVQKLERLHVYKRRCRYREQ